MNEKPPIPLRLSRRMGRQLSVGASAYAGAGRPYCYEAQSELLYPLFRRCARTIYNMILSYSRVGMACVCTALRRRFLPSSKNAACPADLARFGAGSQQN